MSLAAPKVFPRRELGIGFVCAGVLVLEICLTKLFSLVLWYHFGFLAVSTALLGFASSGVYLALKDKAISGEDADPAIGRSAAMAAVAAVLSLWLITQTRFDVQHLVEERTLGSLLALVIWVTLPFFFLGLTIARTLSAFPKQVGRLYGSDLIGSAVGCGLAVLVLSLHQSAQFAIVLGSLLAGIGGIFFAAKRPRSLLFALAGAAVPVSLLVRGGVEETFPVLSTPSKVYYYAVEQIDEYTKVRGMKQWRRGEMELKSGEVLEMESTVPPATTADGEAMAVHTDDGPRMVRVADLEEHRITEWSPHRQWNSMSRVDAFHWPAFQPPVGLWGLSPRFFTDTDGSIPRQKGISLDAWAFTVMTRYSGAPLHPAEDPEVAAERKKLQVLEYLPAGTVHRLKEKADKILCIGAGGGLDLLTAKYFGAKHITGAEINPGVVHVVRNVFPEFVGHLYDPERHPDIDVHVAEGRHFLDRSKDRFDIVQLSGVDTLSSTEAGAFSLSENFLYTKEAFASYLSHLTDDGILTLTRWFTPLVDDETGELEPRYSLRLLGLAREALLDFGVEDPGRCILYLNSVNFTVILLKPSGFTEEDAAKFRAHCDRYDYAMLWSPFERVETIDYLGATHPNPFVAFLESDDPEAYLAASRFDTEPPTDDRPFFFELSRFQHIFDADHYTNERGLTAHGLLVLLFGEVLILGLLFVILPLRRLSAAQRGSRWTRVGLLIYYTAIGLGFILVEIVLSQKFVFFLGHPFFALSVILFSVLLFSGIGAALSAKMPLPRFATLFAAVAAVLSVLLFDQIFESALSFSLPIRITIAVAMLAPVGLLMGVPFPAGVRVLSEVEPSLIPWAWGINGYTSVLGSVLAVMLGIELGFMTVLMVASAIYATGVIGYSLMLGGRKLGDAPADDPVSAVTEGSPST